jgi:hypothetical protein
MNDLVTSSAPILFNGVKLILLIAAISMPLWGAKIIEKIMQPKHKALQVANGNQGLNSTSIVSSVGTTTAGVFLIQVLPLIFSIVGDVGGNFGIDIVYGDFMAGGQGSQFVDSFYGLTAQLGDMLQTSAPLAAVGLGGYNLMNNISRGLPA